MRLRSLLLPALLLPAAARAPAALEARGDARVDLMGVVQLLAGDADAAAAAEHPLLASARETFAPYKGHPAVVRYRALMARGFSGIAPAQFSLYLTQPPELQEAVSFAPLFVGEAGGRAELEAWLAELRDFVRASRFLEWRAARAGAWEEREKALRAQLAERDLEAALVSYLGLKPWSRYVAVPSPFFGHGGSAWIVEETGGLPDVYVVLGMEPLSTERLAAAVWPEAAFAAAYPLFELCRAELKPAPGACGEAQPDNCLERDWVRTLVARLMGRTFGAAARARLESDWPAGPRGAAVGEALARYEKRRKGDILDWAGRLAAPYQAGGAAPKCPPEAASQGIGARRVGYALEARRRASGAR